MTMKRPWWWRLSAEWRDYVRRERAALPDGTRVRLVCLCSRDHGVIWLTSWTPRRMRDINDVDDYRLTSETDPNDTTFAVRDVLEVVE
jgi:hypothetical protein